MTNIHLTSLQSFNSLRSAGGKWNEAALDNEVIAVDYYRYNFLISFGKMIQLEKVLKLSNTVIWWA